MPIVPISCYSFIHKHIVPSAFLALASLAGAFLQRLSMCKRVRKENAVLSWLAARTIKAVFARPTRPSIPFAEVEALVVSLGGEVRESKGSAVVFELP